MRELHVVATSPDGRQVLLSGRSEATTGEYALAVDDRLAAAVRARPRGRVAASATDSGDPGHLAVAGTDAAVGGDARNGEVRADDGTGEPRTGDDGGEDGTGEARADDDNGDDGTGEPRTGDDGGEVHAGDDAPPGPREIQARLRAGESAKQIARSAGMPLARVERFAGPVEGERYRMLQEVRTSRSQRLRLGASLLPLGACVEHHLQRLRTYDPDRTEWSTWREPAGTWVVQVAYRTGARTGRAAWRYDVRRRLVIPLSPRASVLAHVSQETLDEVGVERACELRGTVVLARGSQPSRASVGASRPRELAALRALPASDIAGSARPPRVAARAGAPTPSSPPAPAAVARPPVTARQPAAQQPMPVTARHPVPSVARQSMPSMARDLTPTTARHPTPTTARQDGQGTARPVPSADETATIGRQHVPVPVRSPAAKARPAAQPVRPAAQPVRPAAQSVRPAAAAGAARPRRRPRLTVVDGGAPLAPAAAVRAGQQALELDFEPSAPARRGPERAIVPTWDEVLFGTPRPPSGQVDSARSGTGRG